MSSSAASSKTRAHDARGSSRETFAKAPAVLMGQRAADTAAISSAFPGYAADKLAQQAGNARDGQVPRGRLRLPPPARRRASQTSRRVEAPGAIDALAPRVRSDPVDGAQVAGDRPPRRNARQVQPSPPFQRPEARAAVPPARRASRPSHPMDRGPPGSASPRWWQATSQARKAPGLWFQADPGDADPATFHYVRRVSEIPGRRSRDAAAPVFTADYAGDLPGFSRRFMRELFALFPRRARSSSSTTSTSPKADASWRFAFAEGLRGCPRASISSSSRARAAGAGDGAARGRAAHHAHRMGGAALHAEKPRR